MCYSQGAHLNQNQFNWLGTVFYLSYFAFQVRISRFKRIYTHHLTYILPASTHKTSLSRNSPSANGEGAHTSAFQLPSLTGMNSINIFVWAVALLSHAACKSFGALLAVRFILGMCEGAWRR